MAPQSDVRFADSSTNPQLNVLAEGFPAGICEVVDVAAVDELPYVFEINAGQRLLFSITASRELDLVLCDEEAYDEWIDAGLESEHPPRPILTLRYACQHSLEFKSVSDVTLMAILINLWDSPTGAVVAAVVLDSPRSRF